MTIKNSDRFIAIEENKIKNDYVQLYYNDKKFKHYYIDTDEWWYNKWLPGSHNFLSLEIFINQLYAMSLKYNNPPIICFSIGIYSVKLDEGRLSYSHEDNPYLQHLDDIIEALKNLNNEHWENFKCPSFCGDCDIIFLPIKRKKNQRKRTHIPRGLRHEVFKRDNHRCVKCGAKKEDGAILHIDHIIPVSKGGSDEMDNLQTLCSDCNLNKSNLIQ